MTTNRLFWLASVCTSISWPTISHAQVIIPFGGDWNYLSTVVDDGAGRYLATNPFLNSNGVDFTQWAQLGFDATGPLTTDGRTINWHTGQASFGYGDRETVYGTELSVPFANERDATYYFRHEFTTTEELTNLYLHAVLDDGAVIYLDGRRISSTDSCCKSLVNINYDPLDAPTEPIPYRERATTSNGPCRVEGVVYLEEFSDLVLAPGDHVFAASVHSISANSADMRFDARLSAGDHNEYQGLPQLQDNGSFSAPWGSPSDWPVEECQTTSPAWTGGLSPNRPGAIARLLGIPTRPTTVYNDQNTVVGTVVFDNLHSYALAGLGAFSFDAASNSDALIDVLSGDHEFQAQVRLSDPLEIRVEFGSSLEFNNDVIQQGNTISISGNGMTEFNNRVVGGTIRAMLSAKVSGDGEIYGDLSNAGGIISPGDGIGTLSVFGNYASQSPDSVLAIEIDDSHSDLLIVSGNLDLQGKLRVVLTDGFMPSFGDSFTFFQAGTSSVAFDEFELPELSESLSWDVSNVGYGSLMVVPEPNGVRWLLFVMLGSGFLRRTHRHHATKTCLTFTIAIISLTVVNLAPASAGSPTPDVNYVDFGSSNVSYLHPSIAGDGESDPTIYAPRLSSNQSEFDTSWYRPDFQLTDLQYADGTSVAWQTNASLPIGFGRINGFDSSVTGHQGLATDIGSPDAAFTTYVRIPFTVSDASTSPLVVEYLVDDGADVYLDGQPWTRINCCRDSEGNPVSGSEYQSLANQIGNEQFLQRIAVNGDLVPGDHLLAIGMHPVQKNTSDLGLDFRIYTPGNYRFWASPESGNFANSANWEIGLPGSDDFAIFGAQGTQGGTVVVDADVTLDGIQFQGNRTFNIAGTGVIHLQGDANRPASLNVLNEAHQFQLRVELADNLEAEISAGSSIDFNNELALNGNTIRKTGSGDLIVGNQENVSSNGRIEVNFGVLAGTGTVGGDVHVSDGASITPAGLVEPLETATTLTINGNATIQGGSVRLNAYGNGQGDVISGGGTGQLEFLSQVTLDVDVDRSYVPAHGDSIVVFPGWQAIEGAANLVVATGWSFDATTGSILFGSIEPPTCDLDTDGDCDTVDIDALVDIPGITAAEIDQWLADAGAENGFAGPFHAGDANLDGVVNPQDLNRVGQNWLAVGTTWSSGDFNGDDKTDPQDLNAIGQNWQSVVPNAAATSAVPEPPPSWGLLWIAWMGLARRRN